MNIVKSIIIIRSIYSHGTVDLDSDYSHGILRANRKKWRFFLFARYRARVKRSTVRIEKSGFFFYSHGTVHLDSDYSHGSAIEFCLILQFYENTLEKFLFSK